MMERFNRRGAESAEIRRVSRRSWLDAWSEASKRFLGALGASVVRFCSSASSRSFSFMPRRVTALLAVATAACANATPPPLDADAVETDERAARDAAVSDPVLRPIYPSERVPAFRVETLDGEIADSERLLAERPLVMVFFSSWCPVCDKKLPIVRKALDELRSRVHVLGIVLDEADTWSNVAPYVERHRLHFPMVRGDRHPNFATAYNPISGVPWVLVIDESGFIVDAQLGLAPSHYDRLITAVDLATESRSDSSETTSAR